MQPSPRLDTVSEEVEPRVVWVIVMPPTQRPRARSKSNGSVAASGSLLELPLVDADLVVDGAQVAGHLGQLGLDPLAVGTQQVEPLRLVAGTVTDQRRIASYVA